MQDGLTSTVKTRSTAMKSQKKEMKGRNMRSGELYVAVEGPAEALGLAIASRSLLDRLLPRRWLGHSEKYLPSSKNFGTSPTEIN